MTGVVARFDVREEANAPESLTRQGLVAVSPRGIPASRSAGPTAKGFSGLP
ncbi:hypothetical protein ACIBEA_16495 [Streptomyces sp. NPDC051555]|uniref:hypothetical protein n=1 Tax=Streptomyces sp. NPDC051555 TaxID=3365657 RepID=UPI0037A942BF